MTPLYNYFETQTLLTKNIIRGMVWVYKRRQHQPKINLGKGIVKGEHFAQKGPPVCLEHEVISWPGIKPKSEVLKVEFFHRTT